MALASLVYGIALARNGNPTKALPHLEAGIRFVESQNRGLTVGEERTQHLTEWYESYATLAAALHRAGRDADAFAVMEQSRGRELRRALRSGGRRLMEKVSPAFAAELQTLEAELEALQRTLVEQRSRPAAQRSEDFATLERHWDVRKKRRSELARWLERKHPKVAREAGSSLPATVAELQAVREGEVLLATMVGKQEVLLFQASREHFWCTPSRWGKTRWRFSCAR